MSESLKTLTLLKRWSHHSRSGGYDRLGNYLQGEKIYTKRSSIDRRSIRYRVWYHMVPSSRSVNHYQIPDFLTELKTFHKVLREDFDIVHSLYAEDQLNFLLRFKKRLRSSLIGSFHLPVESQYVQRALSSGHYQHLKKLDAAIVVSSSMMNDFEKFVGKDKVFFVPHGIDTDIFLPGNSGKSGSHEFNILSVGKHGRDWKTIEKVLQTIDPAEKSINFNAVLPEYQKQEVAGIDGVNIYSNIPEKELIELYQKADILLLPLNFGTANNSILESLACGTPVISTKVGGIPDYVDEKSGWLFDPKNVVGIKSLIDSMLNNPVLYLSKREEARKKALTFDWKKVAEMVQDVYTEVQKRKKRSF